LRLSADMSLAYYGKPLIVTYSGGKDSDVMLYLAATTLKPHEFEVFNSHTTVDAPETVYHIRDTFKKLNKYGIKTFIDYHIVNGKPVTMWNLIPKKSIPPTRIFRYCCTVLKEAGTPNRIASLGVREAESNKRAGRQIFGIRGKTYKDANFYSLSHAEEVHRESQEINDPVWDCKLIETMKKHGEAVVNPIYHWSDSDIWNFIQQNHIETNPLYQCGYTRVGCIGCPLAAHNFRVKEFEDYPRFKKCYVLAFEKMLKVNKEKGLKYKREFKTGEEVFEWWMEEHKYNIKRTDEFVRDRVIICRKYFSMKTKD